MQSLILSIRGNENTRRMFLFQAEKPSLQARKNNAW